MVVLRRINGGSVGGSSGGSSGFGSSGGSLGSTYVSYASSGGSAAALAAATPILLLLLDTVVGGQVIFRRLKLPIPATDVVYQPMSTDYGSPVTYDSGYSLDSGYIDSSMPIDSYAAPGYSLDSIPMEGGVVDPSVPGSFYDGGTMYHPVVPSSMAVVEIRRSLFLRQDQWKVTTAH